MHQKSQPPDLRAPGPGAPRRLHHPTTGSNYAAARQRRARAHVEAAARLRVARIFPLVWNQFFDRVLAGHVRIIRALDFESTRGEPEHKEDDGEACNARIRRPRRQRRSPPP